MKNTVLRKITAIALCLVLALSLAGCKSSEVKNVEQMITDLGEVTADSKTAVEALETAYAALSDSDKEQVENAGAIAEARAALDAALKEAKYQAILGTWNVVQDATDSMVGEMAEALDLSAEETGEYIGEMKLKSTLTLREDGTYRIEMDVEQLAEDMTNLIKNLKPLLKSVLLKSFATEMLGSDEEISEEEVDALLVSVLGVSLDEFIDLMLEEMNPEDMIGSVDEEDKIKEGKFEIDLDKDIIYFSESLEEEPDKANGENFVLGDGTMKIETFIGEGFFDEFYPVEFTKIA